MIIGKDTIKQENGEKQYEVVIDNGDLKLIDSLMDAYGFKDKESLFKFAIGTLLQGNNNEGIFTIRTGDDNKRVLEKIAPSSDMLNPNKE